jgi:hypothetical protein
VGKALKVRCCAATPLFGVVVFLYPRGFFIHLYIIYLYISLLNLFLSNGKIIPKCGINLVDRTVNLFHGNSIPFGKFIPPNGKRVPDF